MISCFCLFKGEPYKSGHSIAAGPCAFVFTKAGETTIHAAVDNVTYHICLRCVYLCSLMEITDYWVYLCCGVAEITGPPGRRR